MFQRYGLLDTVRGIAVVSMVLYHFCYDLVYMFSVSIAWFNSGLGFLWQQSICWTFIFLAGMCWNLGKNHLKKGIILTFWGLVITGVTLFIMPEAPIIFGVLSFLGIAILCQILTEKLLRRFGWSDTKVLIVSFIVFILLLSLDSLEIMLGEGIKEVINSNVAFGVLGVFGGLPPEDFVSVDYFPFFPWYFLFLAGCCFYRSMKDNCIFQQYLSYTCKPLAFLGRHALLLYLAHQPVIYGILSIVFYSILPSL